MKELYNFLTALINTPTISGYESDNIEKIAGLCLEFADGFFDGYEILPSGSILFCKKCGKDNAKKIVLDAHIDTIGFAINEICGNGFVKVTNLGGVDPYILPATPVKIYGKEEIYGVFSSIPPHLAGKGGTKDLKISDLYVDTGLTDELLEGCIKIGDPCGFADKPMLLCNDTVASHSLDDKACVAAAILACKYLADDGEDCPCDVYVHLAVGEEKTALGAKTLPYMLNADGCIVLDVNFAYTQGVEVHESLILGGGSGVSYSASIKRELTDFIVDTAIKEELPIQSVVEMRSTGTNATQMHRNGIPSAVLSIPLKNMHTFSEEVAISDIVSCADVLEAVILNFDEFESTTQII